jgi:hypothetical protein
MKVKQDYTDTVSFGELEAGTVFSIPDPSDGLISRNDIFFKLEGNLAANLKYGDYFDLDTDEVVKPYYYATVILNPSRG